MNYKRTWNKANGKSEIITMSNSPMTMLEIDMLRLKNNETKTYCEQNKEYGLIIFGGHCTIKGEDFMFAEIGQRQHVFDGTATAVYISRNKKFAITGLNNVSIAVCKSPATRDFESKLIQPEDVIVKNLGKTGWERQAHFILDERIEANRLYIGEAFVTSGNWASYPPHKHDDDNMPTEGFLEEIYYYEFDKPQGFGIQKVYTKEGNLDKTYTVKSGDLVMIPKGYHPFCCAPGYNNYYLWIMAGQNRGFYMTTEEEHQWLNQ
jgi:5-deoxy-glucuronate isomerase